MKKVIFDVDGVLLSEERYYDVSALTVWEILYGRQYMGLPSEREDFDASAVTDGQIAAIRSEVWGKDSLLSWLKQRGINSNWDMVHAWLITCFWLFGRSTADAPAVMCFLSASKRNRISMRPGWPLWGCRCRRHRT